MKTKTPKADNRPRFGWCDNLDSEPQHVHEGNNADGTSRPVVVIPLPFHSAKFRKQCRAMAQWLNVEKWRVLTALALVALALAGSGCASMYGAQVRQNDHARQSYVKAMPLQGGAGVGFDVAALFDKSSAMPQTAGEWAAAAGELAVDIATVAGTGYGVYKATKGSDSGTAAPSIPSIQTGDNSPVQINVGSGTASQHNPNTTTSTSSTGARRH